MYSYTVSDSNLSKSLMHGERVRKETLSDLDFGSSGKVVTVSLTCALDMTIKLSKKRKQKDILSKDMQTFIELVSLAVNFIANHGVRVRLDSESGQSESYSRNNSTDANVAKTKLFDDGQFREYTDTVNEQNISPMVLSTSVSRSRFPMVHAVSESELSFVFSHSDMNISSGSLKLTF